MLRFTSLLGVEVAGTAKARVHEASWLVAFIVLVLNDHVLKGAGVLPGAVTGKLSDFTGLFVAPVVLSAACALAGARGPRVRALCFGATALMFAGIKLSPAATRALGALLTVCGVPSRFWADPWDLVALLVLPLAWRTAAALEQRPALARSFPHRVAVVLGALGCVATSTYDPSSSHKSSAYVVNMSNRPFDFQVLRLRSEFACEELETAAGSAVYRAEYCASLATGHFLPLDRDFEWIHDTEDEDQESLPSPPDDPACDAVVLRGKGVADTLVYWQTTPNRDVGQRIYLEEAAERDEVIADEHALVLEEALGRLHFTGTDVMRIGTLAESPPEADCSELPTFEEYMEARAK